MSFGTRHHTAARLVCAADRLRVSPSPTILLVWQSSTGLRSGGAGAPVVVAVAAVAVAYPDPKIVTVAAPTNQVNATRPTPTGSTRSTALQHRYIVSLGRGQHLTTHPGRPRQWHEHVESRMRWEPHVRLGGRAAETPPPERLVGRRGPTPTHGAPNLALCELEAAGQWCAVCYWWAARQGSS